MAKLIRLCLSRQREIPTQRMKSMPWRELSEARVDRLSFQSRKGESRRTHKDACDSSSLELSPDGSAVFPWSRPNRATHLRENVRPKTSVHWRTFPGGAPFTCDRQKRVVVSQAVHSTTVAVYSSAKRRASSLTAYFAPLFALGRDGARHGRSAMPRCRFITDRNTNARRRARDLKSCRLLTRGRSGPYLAMKSESAFLGGSSSGGRERAAGAGCACRAAFPPRGSGLDLPTAPARRHQAKRLVWWRRWGAA